ncbi:MAG: YfcE family phosphodiesterase [Chloroflexi bacterium]|nr:YfcE family phosphodiesterase [Chloroflexota bacterium]
MSHREVTFGVLSDTHLPKRLRRVPDAVFRVLQGVDLVLHAGDVGDLSVLDSLSQIAPVIAVHGNDESPESVNALPYRQLIVAAGHRVLLTHGHFTDPIMETAQRADDNWPTSFERWASVAREHGADVMFYGHSHIPSVTQVSGVWLINGGALASANIATRQAIKTVARVTLRPKQPPQVVHYDLAHPDEPHIPPTDYEAGFGDFYARYSTSILTPELWAQNSWIRDELISVAGVEVISDPLLPLAHECWEGTRDMIGVEEVVTLWKTHPKLPLEIIDKLRTHPVFSKYL